MSREGKRWDDDDRALLKANCRMLETYCLNFEVLDDALKKEMIKATKQLTGLVEKYVK